VKRAAFEAHARSLDGKTLNVTVGASNVWCPTRVKRLRPVLQNNFDSSRPNLVAQVAATNKTYTWTFRDPKLITKDDFPEVLGSKGGPDASEHKQRKVVKGLTGLTGRKGDLLLLWKHLYPGDLDTHVARINVAIKKDAQRKKAKHPDVDVDEYITFIGLMHAARCETQRGRALWEEKTTGYTRPPHFDDFMPRNRFDLLKKTVPFAFADLATKQKDVWYMVNPVVKGFNENRRRTIRAGRVLTIDELMVAFRPRTSKRGGLPHLSFIMRKPKPPGTEFKCVADGSTGIMLFLELQEGAGRMGTRAYVKETRSKIAACGLRLAFGSALKGGDLGGL
jgi:hypothetical protein